MTSASNKKGWCMSRGWRESLRVFDAAAVHDNLHMANVTKNIYGMDLCRHNVGRLFILRYVVIGNTS